jgi:D-glycero-alpha-D-manno-heptose-7-phosphate kinase
VAQLEANTLVFYTGISRSASMLLKQQSAEVAGNAEKQRSMLRMVQLAYDMRQELHRNNISAFGEILHENWMLKRSMVSGVSTDDIDEWYRVARAAGATGGKILGAGAGGFLMLYAPLELHERIKLALHMLRPIPLGFEPLGSRIIFYH